MTGTRLYMISPLATEPMPNTAQTTDTISAGTYRACRDSDLKAGSSATRNDQSFAWDDSLTTKYTNVSQFISPPLKAISLSSQTWKVNTWNLVTALTGFLSTCKPRCYIYGWDSTNDAIYATKIRFPTTYGTNLTTTSTAYSTTALGNALTLVDGDRIVVELNFEYFNQEAPLSVKSTIGRLNFNGASGTADTYVELGTDTLEFLTPLNNPHAGI